MLEVPMCAAQPSFYDRIPDRRDADHLFAEYLGFLETRNGALAGAGRFERREAQMETFDAVEPEHAGWIDADTFQRAWVDRAEDGAPADLLALLTFVKMNANEAYGVEVTRRARARFATRPEAVYRVEGVVQDEEDYHTRLLVGAARHFGLELRDAWRPAIPLQVLIFCIARSPALTFHPILLSSEIAGIYIFNWMLTRLGTLFADLPDVRESMERRLIEVLIDEVGHVAFNRVAMTEAGMPFVRPLAGAVLASAPHTMPEIVALGFDAQKRRGLSGFDYADLPEEVRRRAFFA
jgi:hypothetical protein